MDANFVNHYDDNASIPTMHEIVPNLWLGDLLSALDAKTLRAKGVRSVLSVMRGRVSVHEVRAIQWRFVCLKNEVKAHD